MKIRSDILRTYQSIHTWTGITTGLLLFIAFFAGALTMFKSPITQWAVPENHVLPAISVGQYDELVQQATAQYEAANNGFTLHFDQHHSPMTWYEQGGGRGLSIDSHLRQASFNKEGELVSVANQQNLLGDLIDQLHRTAGIPGKAGHEDIGVLLLGVASALYFIALVSGVIFLLPTLVKSFFSLRQKKGANRFWLDTHNLIGITSLPFHLLIAWTVVVFAFHDMLYGGLSLIYGDEPMFERNGGSKQVYSVAELPPVERYFEAVGNMVDGYDIVSLTFADLATPRARLSIEVAGDGKLQRAAETDIIAMHPFTLDVTYSTLSIPENGAFGPLVKSFFALHFGNFANDTGRWIYFLLGMMGAILFYTGNLLWLEKRRQKQAKQSRSVTIMAKLTIGVCLGSVLGVATSILASKWLYLAGVDINLGYINVYYGVFIASLGFAFWQGAAKSAIALQALIAATCLGVPLTSFFTVLFSHDTHWHFAGGTLLVDGLALVFAWIFFKAARKTRQRAYQGEPDSIWFIPSKVHATPDDSVQPKTI
ncbi:MAG: PepSY domain-containing protein [Aestuariibacter sp.]|uniref:PepSY-associated TM helix domain-containing protein n=1 Tax=Marisediminitalea aggregata TaxID=634436 RepID=UPI0020CCF117|nr:PepSY-associated TM helix domain-containing protein [Marisediminitalea aggregata]MCP3863429.1 PepSY domain-containing protein [Aestuariibacter sp.]MCP4232299.1 PepSY domain-containing protein [Aestuariibacter sp.]MCP4526027.1 PepSY domain-containing protein [Aestuariibacter sp.]MCP4946576.1 PepSY domain-containing protein [Aestuariibacter sp.]MCP5009518.1 PepSY domain-containing protein [Aestuariibacter sp.]